MKIFTLLILLTTQISMANNFTDELQKLEHENFGCPINSLCSKKMGEKMKDWENFIESTNSKNQFKKLSKYFKARGIPLLYLTKKEAKISFDPIMWDSRCRFHLPKNPNNRVMKALEFLKKLPKSSLHNFTPVEVYLTDKTIRFKAPYEDYPIAMKGNKLIFVKDYDDFYYYYSVDDKGNLQIENLSPKLIRSAMDKKQDNIKCPKKLDFNEEYFSQTYCQKIMDLKSNELKIVQYAWSCP